MGREPGADTHDVVYLVKRSAYEMRFMVPKTFPPSLAQPLASLFITTNDEDRGGHGRVCRGYGTTLAMDGHGRSVIWDGGS